MEYNLIENGDRDEFCALINQMLALGWELHGPTTFEDHDSGSGPEWWYMQAMVRVPE